MNSFRAPSEYEQRLVVKLLEPPLVGREALLQQLSAATVSQWAGDRSLEFIVPNTAPPAATRSAIPTEGQFEDVDAATIHVLLHLKDGRLHILEIFKENGSAVEQLPDPSSLRLFRPE